MSNNVVYEALSITTDTGIHYVGSSVTHLYIYRPSVSQKLEQNTSSNWNATKGNCNNTGITIDAILQRIMI